MQARPKKPCRDLNQVFLKETDSQAAGSDAKKAKKDDQAIDLQLAMLSGQAGAVPEGQSHALQSRAAQQRALPLPKRHSLPLNSERHRDLISQGSA